jgi:hypothetical protein
VTRLRQRIVALLLASMACASVSHGYYHFIRFNSRTAPWRALTEKFDLNALPNKTLSYFISDQAALQFAPSDSFGGLVSQIRAAAQVWNSVETSDLRLAFGGFTAAGIAQTAPTLDVLFDEVTPGLVAMAGITMPGESNGTFVPILKSVVIIRPDMADRPSYTERVFGTLVHEFGHALGLQHTMTSSVMSTYVTRATSKAKPLAIDDIAGISVLYPARTLASSTGSIAGRVLLQGGRPVNLASVVAISPAGAAISALTNPDGTFRIDGMPPMSYQVYVHPLPPPYPGETTFAGLRYPKDLDGDELAPTGFFETAFFRSANVGTNDPDSASLLTVTAGNTLENVNFMVRPKGQAGIHSVEAFAYPGGIAVKPPYLNASIAQPFLVVRGQGLTNGAGAVPGLRVRVLSGPTLGIQPFATPSGTNLQLYFDARTLAISTETPRHLVFSTNNDLYVLPAGFFHVERQPPLIASIAPVTENGLRLAVLTGANLTLNTRVLFDGADALVRSFDEVSSRLTVIAPHAPLGHRANVIAINPDGQSSLFLQGDTPPVYTYAPLTPLTSAVPAFAASPSMLTAGTETMIQVDTMNTNFVEGMVSVGFGTSDIVARRLWVVSPTQLLVNVSVGPFAQVGAHNLTIASGLQVISQAAAVHVQPANPRLFWLTSSVTNLATQQRSVNAGAMASLVVGNSPVVLTPGAAVFLGERQVPVVLVNNGNELVFQVPANTAVGPVVVRAEAMGERSLPIAIAIDPPAPRILSASSANQRIDSNRAAYAGESIDLFVTNLKIAGNGIDLSRLVVNIGGIVVNAIGISEVGEGHRITLVLPPHTPVGQVPISVELNDRTSEPINVSIRG